MKVTETDLPGVLLIEPIVITDRRGFFTEQFNTERYSQAGISGPWMQDNLSRSTRGVLRGLHFQNPKAQGKLVNVLSGAIFDVAVDIRKSSPTFGRWTGVELTAENRHQLWTPPGFAHGFLVLSDFADVSYKCSENYYDKPSERCIYFDDPDIGIRWPGEVSEINERDRAAPRLADADVYS